MPYDWYRKNIYTLDKTHDPKDKTAALNKALETNKLPIGIFYQADKPAFHEQISNASDTSLTQHDISSIDLTNILWLML